MSKFSESIPHARELLGDDTTQLFLNQVLLALVIKHRCELDISVEEIDATGGWIMEMEIDHGGRTFKLKARKKQ